MESKRRRSDRNYSALLNRLEAELSFPYHQDPEQGNVKAIAGRALFDKSLGLLREDMPQIDNAHFSEFMQYAKDRGVEIQRESVVVGTLKPAQVEYNPARVAQLAPEALLQPLMISQDDYILDGTNRFVRLMTEDKNQMVQVNRLMLPAREAIAFMNSFPKTFSRSVSKFSANLARRFYFDHILEILKNNVGKVR